MSVRSLLKIVLAAALLFFPLSQLIEENVAFSQTDDVPRITVQDLKAKLDKGEDVIIIDSREGKDYGRSKIKIKGAIRIALPNMEDRYKELPANKEIVIYCT